MSRVSSTQLRLWLQAKAGTEAVSLNVSAGARSQIGPSAKPLRTSAPSTVRRAMCENVGVDGR